MLNKEFKIKEGHRSSVSYDFNYGLTLDTLGFLVSLTSEQLE